MDKTSIGERDDLHVLNSTGASDPGRNDQANPPDLCLSGIHEAVSGSARQ